ncbi:hypothetical protein [Candidatus Nanohalobium constans]|uniref:hypothetical protein n=1 Tax=Candidatus Nanohalobium constans TaxID=2565781 RepID=UPI0012983B8B|nr:hypothetical protein [Candidatus Nanohalobium constans]
MYGGKSISREDQERYEEVIETAAMLEMELKRLDDAVAQVLEAPPSAEEWEYRMEGDNIQNEYFDKGDFF